MLAVPDAGPTDTLAPVAVHGSRFAWLSTQATVPGIGVIGVLPLGSTAPCAVS